MPVLHKRLITKLDWEDLVVTSDTTQKLKAVSRKLIVNDSRSNIQKYNGIVFYGPNSTAKRDAVALLAKQSQKKVYRVDLSSAVSKYIGETEKNIGKIFDLAESKDWILFFDEADALFGKRTGIKDSHDKYANQEVAYILQRIEAHNGLICLATNMRQDVSLRLKKRFKDYLYFT